MDFSIKQALTVVVVLVAAVAVVATAISMTDKNNKSANDQNDKMWGQVNKQEHITHNLFDATRLPTKSQGGATVTNNGDGSFTISGSGNLSENFYLNYTIMHDEIVKMFKVGKVHVKLEKPTNPYFYVNVYKNNVFHKTLFSTITSTQLNSDILAEYINDNSYKFLLGFGGAKGSTIQSGTIRPILYQE